MLSLAEQSNALFTTSKPHKVFEEKTWLLTFRRLLAQGNNFLTTTA